MQQQVGLAHLVQRTFERIHQVGRQFTDKTDRIGQQEGQIVDDNLAHRRVQRSEQLVLGKHVTLREQVHQRAFPHVGVAHQRHPDHTSAIAPLRRLLAVDFGQTLLQKRHPVQDDTAVHLQLCLARTAQPHGTLPAARAGTASLTLQVRPQALQTGQHVTVLCQLHLRLGIRRLGTHGEDVEYQRRTVEYLDFQFLFYIT